MISRLEQLSASCILSLPRVRVTSDARIPSRILSISLLDDASLYETFAHRNPLIPITVKAIEGAYPKDRVTHPNEKDHAICSHTKALISPLQETLEALRAS